MGIFKYKSEIRCSNCGETSIIKIPKGITVKNHIKSGNAKCKTCKCDTVSQFSINGDEEDSNEEE